jgi:very-short-patch-repair endonuclease
MDRFAETALRLADRQHGIVCRRQLRREGIPERTIAGRVARGRLFTVYRGVYLVGRRHLTYEGLLVASALSAGDGAVLHCRSAAAVWGILDHRNPVEVVRTSTSGRVERARIKVEGQNWWPHLVVRETRSLPRSHVVFRGCHRITSTARTLFDLASVLPPHRLERAFMEADRQGLLDDQMLSEVAILSQGRKNGAAIRHLVSRRIPGISQARSVLESLVLELVAAGDISRPDVNRSIAGYVPDFAWPSARLIVEADGYEFHRGREAFERDTLRSNRLRALGWTVLRVTWRQVSESPDEVARMIRAALKH